MLKSQDLQVGGGWWTASRQGNERNQIKGVGSLFNWFRT